MVVSLNPVISSNTTGVIAFGKSDAKTKTTIKSLKAGKDTVQLSKTSKNLHGFFPTVGRGIQRAVRDIIILATVFTGSQMLKSCEKDPGLDPEIKKTGMELYEEAPVEQAWEANWDSLGIKGNPKKYLDNRTGEYIELNITETIPGEKLIGTETHTGIDGLPNGVYNIEVAKTADNKGVEKKIFVSGQYIGSNGYEMAENVTRDGIKQTTNGNYNWLLHPPVKKVDNKKIIAELIEKGAKQGFKTTLDIIK